MDGLSPVAPISSFLLVRLLPSRAASGACVTGVVTISWRRRWHRRVAAIACLWRSRRAVPRSCSPSRPIRCGGRFGLLLLPLPPSVCPLDDLAPFISLSFGCKLSPSPLLLEGGPTRKGRVPCLGVWIIEFIIQLNEELFIVWPNDMRGRPRTRYDGHHDVSSILGRRSMSILVTCPAHRRNRL